MRAGVSGAFGPDARGVGPARRRFSARTRALSKGTSTKTAANIRICSRVTVSPPRGCSNPSDEVPCASEPCKDGIHGYQYNFRFETMMDDIAVIARFDYITTDVSGDKQPQYRTQAIEAFTAAMDTIASEI